MVDISKLKVGDEITFKSGEMALVKSIDRGGADRWYIEFVREGYSISDFWSYEKDGSWASNPRHPDSIVHVNTASEKPSANSVESTLEERGKRYGTFEDNGEIAQSLKDVLTKGKEWGNMPLHHKEALHMICSKMSRIVTADFSYDDNYRDIIGYATLILNELEK